MSAICYKHELPLKFACLDCIEEMRQAIEDAIVWFESEPDTATLPIVSVLKTAREVRP